MKSVSKKRIRLLEQSIQQRHEPEHAPQYSLEERTLLLAAFTLNQTA